MECLTRNRYFYSFVPTVWSWMPFGCFRGAFQTASDRLLPDCFQKLQFCSRSVQIAANFADRHSTRKINYRACERKWGLILGCLTRNRDFCSFVPPVWSWMDSAIDVGDSFCDRSCDSFCDKNCDSFCDSNFRPSQHYDRIHITS